MKKIISLLLCVALLCSMVVVVAHADGAAYLQCDDAVALPGASVTIALNIMDNPGLCAVQLNVLNNDGLGVTYEGTDAAGDTLSLTANDAKGIYFWGGATTNQTTQTIGYLTITISEEAEAGEYTFTLAQGTGNAQASDQVGGLVDIDSTTFTITVTDKAITGVNVAIDASLAIGIHVSTTDAENTSITAVDVAGEEFITVTDYEEDEENGGYIYYLNVNPWDMDKEFTVDFTDNFTIDEETDELALGAIPATARTIGILSYCEAVKGTSEELDQLIADLLEFGRQAQLFNGKEVPTYALPDGLAATEAAWENGDGDPCSFGDYCSENFPEDLTGKNKTAQTKFVFDSATIEFGSQFVVTFTVKQGSFATAQPSTVARMKVDGTVYSLDGWNFVYSFNPAQYGGVEFDLYAATSTTATNFAWINVYGPAHYAAYLAENYGEDAADILAILEAFYLYGASVEAYVATLG